MREIQIRILVPEFVYRLCIWLLLLYRRVRYGYAFRRIPLTQGKFAIVDVADYERLAKYKWFAIRYARGFYAVRAIKERDARGRKKGVRMHRAISDVPPAKSSTI